MQQFPGRTLEELDGIDWLRLQRAVAVGEIIRTEDRYRMYHAKQIERLTPAEMMRVQEHDRLLDEFYADSDDDGSEA
jgi:hypothetical protein